MGPYPGNTPLSKIHEEEHVMAKILTLYHYKLYERSNKNLRFTQVGAAVLAIATAISAPFGIAQLSLSLALLCGLFALASMPQFTRVLEHNDNWMLWVSLSKRWERFRKLAAEIDNLEVLRSDLHMEHRSAMPRSSQPYEQPLITECRSIIELELKGIKSA